MNIDYTPTFATPKEWEGAEDDSTTIEFSALREIEKSISEQLPEYPVNVLPRILRGFIRTESDNIQVFPGMMAIPVFGTLATCVQGNYMINVREGFCEPLSLFTMIIADPSERKTSCISAATRPITTFEIEQNKKLDSKIKAERQQIEALENKAKALKRRKDFEAVTAIEAEIQQLKDNGTHRLRLTCDDVTNEALFRLMSENNGRIALVSGEPDIFGMLLGRYQRNTSLSLFLSPFSGEAVSNDRAGRDEAFIIDHPALSIVLASQSYTIEQITSNRELSGRGLLSRFLYGFFPYRERDMDGKPLDEQAVTDYNNLIHMLLADHQPEPVIITIDRNNTEMYELLNNYHKELEVSRKEYIDVRDWYGKCFGLMSRILGIIHIVNEFTEHGKVISRTVTTSEVRSAIEITRYFELHTRHAYRIVTRRDSEIEENAKYLWGKLTKLCKTASDKSDLPTITVTKLLRQARRFDKADQMIDSLNLLEDHGYIKQETFKAGNGATTKLVYVNPAALATNQ